MVMDSNFKKNIKLILLHILTYVAVICLIFIFSKILYIPVRDNKGVEYINSRLIFITYCVNFFSGIFGVYLLWRIIVNKKFILLIVLFLVLCIVIYLNVFMYL